jgi:hypothetical protein
MQQLQKTWRYTMRPTKWFWFGMCIFFLLMIVGVFLDLLSIINFIDENVATVMEKLAIIAFLTIGALSSFILSKMKTPHEKQESTDK